MANIEKSVSSDWAVCSLVGTLLQRAGFEVIGRDARPVEGLTFSFDVLDVSDTAALKRLRWLWGAVSCLPTSSTCRLRSSLRQVSTTSISQRTS